MDLPTAEEIRAAVRKYRDSWALLDGLLYAVCAANPRHDTLDVVTAKVSLVNGVYRAALERPALRGWRLFAAVANKGASGTWKAEVSIA